MINNFEEMKIWMQNHFLPGVESKNGHEKYLLHFVDNERIDHYTLEDYATRYGKAPKPDHTKGKYLRIIRVDGLYPKNHPDLNQCLFCTTGSDRTTIADPALCGGNEAKELRFCSVVMYWKPYRGMVEICSMMTNFLE